MNKFNQIVAKYVTVLNETRKDLPRSLDEALVEYGWEGEMEGSNIAIGLAASITDICYALSYYHDIPLEWSVRNFCDRVGEMDYEDVKESMEELIEMFNNEGIPFTCKNVFHAFMDIINGDRNSLDYRDTGLDINNLGKYM